MRYLRLVKLVAICALLCTSAWTEEETILTGATVTHNDIEYTWCPDPDAVLSNSFKSFYHQTVS